MSEDPSAVASGPTVVDPTTWADCRQIVDKYSLADALPSAVVRRIEQGVAGRVDETAKSLSEGNTVECVGSNRECLNAIEQTVMAQARSQLSAPALDPSSLVVVRESEPLQGEARLIGRQFARRLAAMAETAESFSDRRPRLYLAGGETTVTLGPAQGLGHKGGRNQELALSFAIAAEEGATEEGVGEGAAKKGKEAPALPALDWVFLSAGTDGLDGPTDAAGTIIDSRSLELCRARGVDPEAALAAHDSYHALEAADALLRTGATGTNVGDVQLLLVWFPEVGEG